MKQTPNEYYSSEFGINTLTVYLAVFSDLDPIRI